MSDTPNTDAINTNKRLFDLVRYMRSALHEGGLITDHEYAWLCSGSPMASSESGDSPSVQRLEDYDDLIKAKEQIERELNAAKSRITTLHTQLNQRWEMMRELEVECGTKDVAEAVNFIKGLKARYGAVEKFADELAECASQIGWTSSENVTWIRRAESAVSAYRKAKGSK